MGWRNGRRQEWLDGITSAIEEKPLKQDGTVYDGVH